MKDAMNEHYCVKRFNEDIDKLLKEGHQGHFETGSEESRQVLELAQLLVKIDFSKESCIEHELRQRLLSKLEKRKGTQFRAAELEDDELQEEELENVAGGLDCNLPKKTTVDE